MFMGFFEKNTNDNGSAGAYKGIIIPILGIFIILGTIYFIYKNDLYKIKPIDNNKTEEVIKVPQKKDFGTTTPEDFPSNIPIEKDTKVEQSYSLNYAGQKQLTIVFQSNKTVEENYRIYTEFFKKQNWSISNKYENPQVSSLYGVKENNDINVTISEIVSDISVKSQVSISVLKK